MLGTETTKLIWPERAAVSRALGLDAPIDRARAHKNEDKENVY